MKRPAIVRFRVKRRPVDKSDPIYRLYADILTPLLEWLTEEKQELNKAKQRVFNKPSRN